MNKSNAEEVIAILWFILAAVIVGTQGWGVFSVIAVILGLWGVVCSVYRAAEEAIKIRRK